MTGKNYRTNDPVPSTSVRIVITIVVGREESFNYMGNIVGFWGGIAGPDSFKRGGYHDTCHIIHIRICSLP